MGKVICAVENCGRTRENPNSETNSKISFFSFPKEEALLQQWLDFINEHNDTKYDKDSLDRKRMRLCNLHFQKKDIRGKNKERVQLLPSSVPKVCSTKPKAKKLKPVIKPATDAPEGTPITPILPPDANTTTTPSTVPPTTDDKPESAPLYHSINGYVVDLRFASQLEMFRLPNGKLIQVRKQAKKVPPATTAVAPPEKANDPGEKTKENEKETEELPDVTVEKVMVTRKKSEKRSKKTTSSKKAVPAPAQAPAPELEKSGPPVKILTPVNFKTYANRKSVTPATPTPATAPRTPQAPAEPQSISLSDAPTLTPVRPPNPMPQTQPQKPRRPIVAPCLTALQELIYKTHDEMTPFDLFQKQFENQLISTAEIALHLVAKINNLISSNPFKTAETEYDLKYMYHHVGYILKYAIDRFTGITECCAKDIMDMGFTEKADLGPVFGTEKNSEPPTPKPQADKPAEPEPKEADEDCAIVEEQPDMIEIDSDDDDDNKDDQQPQKPPKIEPSTTPVKPSVEQSNETPPRTSPNASKYKQTSVKQHHEHQFIIREIDEPRGVIRQDSETTLKIANVIEQYYPEESSDSSESSEAAEEEEKEKDKAEPSKQEPGVEAMEVDEGAEPTGDSPISTVGHEENEEEQEEEETTELIEIIDGEEEAETDNDPEYGVVECGDGDYYLVTTDGDEV